jgi:hypothetical protein
MRYFVVPSTAAAPCFFAWPVASQSPARNANAKVGTTVLWAEPRAVRKAPMLARPHAQSVCDVSGESWVDRRKQCTDARVRIAPRLALANGCRKAGIPPQAAVGAKQRQPKKRRESPAPRTGGLRHSLAAATLTESGLPACRHRAAVRGWRESLRCGCSSLSLWSGLPGWRQALKPK